MSDGADARLRLQFCEPCGRWAMPTEPSCPDCDGVLLDRDASGNGTVFTYTVNHHPFNPALPVPYVIAIVELVEQAHLRLAANIIDCQPDSVTVGMPVVARLDAGAKVADVVSVPAFAPRRNS